jgi:DNA-binding transcriptional MerR regulator
MTMTKISTEVRPEIEIQTRTIAPENEAQADTLELSVSAHLQFAENTDDPSVPLTASEPISIPAALCDDSLLEEINRIPDRMGFKIGDVADILGIKQYVLRYWETEFDILSPKKASNNQRMYTRKDVENALLIRKLLHRDRFSIEGARNALKELKAHVRKEKDFSQVFHRLENVHEGIEDLVLDIRRLRQLFK